MGLAFSAPTLDQEFSMVCPESRVFNVGERHAAHPRPLTVQAAVGCSRLLGGASSRECTDGH